MVTPAHQSCPPHSDGTCEGSDQETGGSFVTSSVEDRAERSVPGGATKVLRESANGLGAHGEKSPSKMRDAIAPLASAHGSATPAADDEGTAECTGPALPLSPVTKSGVTAGERLGTLSLVMPLEGGGEVRFFAVHGRVEMQIRVGKQRTWLTTAVSAERAFDYSQRLASIARAAAIQRQKKGA